MADPKLVEYVKSSLAKGYTEAKIKQSLANSEWSAEDIDKAMAAATGKEKKKYIIILIGFIVGIGLGLLFASFATAEELVCGNGVIENNELCDDENGINNDGCSSSCKIELGWFCNGEPSDCIPICGDELLKGTEQCDDGNTLNGDGCSSTCTAEPVISYVEV